MNFKKIASFSAALAFGLMVSACSDSEDSSKSSTAPVVNPESSAATDPAADPATDPSADPATDPSTDPATVPGTRAEVIPDTTYPFEVSATHPVTNNLQGKAMKYLDKGINFTNWLEDTFKFTGEFKFDESDIKLLADNGIKSLRFPIDLDIYTDWENYVAGVYEDITFDDANLFMVLDSFNVWTEKHNISFVIDYHEYDNSYNKTNAQDPRYVTMMARVWKHVAKHYASSPRDDLFFELLNEPDMSSGAVTSPLWRTAAQEIIDSIRVVDGKHTIIFGDAKWYSITALANGQPLKDDNIVYAIHTYEPFIFTHQGASWTEHADVHDLKFPYDAETWSEDLSVYGITDASPKNSRTLVKNYPNKANKEVMKTAIEKAKTWAVNNNLPVIINEFGAYNVVSDKQSVLNYMTVMREISEELQIPLTHWGYTGGFSLFESEDGSAKGTKLIEGMKEAYGL